MAAPLRFRHSSASWDASRVHNQLYQPLDGNLGTDTGTPWYAPPSGFEARRFDVDNGDTALFAWNGQDAYWIGNTETPSALWRTDKYGFDEVPYPIARWAQRELLAGLHEDCPWLKPYQHLSWFFLPVLCSKDGRESTRRFFRDRAAGFPETDREAALDYLESILRTGVLDDYRDVMAGKLGTSTHLDSVRMRAAMGEFNAAKLLTDAGAEITPEAAVDSGHSLDYRVKVDGTETLVEVTRPLPTDERSASSPHAALRDTVNTKTSGQLRQNSDVLLLVDASSFPTPAWDRLRREEPVVGHDPAIVFHVRPGQSIDWFAKGRTFIDLEAVTAAPTPRAR